jgi:hypothetical protein
MPMNRRGRRRGNRLPDVAERKWLVASEAELDADARQTLGKPRADG